MTSKTVDLTLTPDKEREIREAVASWPLTYAAPAWVLSAARFLNEIDRLRAQLADAQQMVEHQGAEIEGLRKIEGAFREAVAIQRRTFGYGTDLHLAMSTWAENHADLAQQVDTSEGRT